MGSRGLEIGLVVMAVLREARQQVLLVGVVRFFHCWPPDVKGRGWGLGAGE